MCTLTLLWKCHPAAPLVVAMNRDEFLARPTEGFSAWTSNEGIPLYAGRDRLSGGTWFGVGKRVVAGLTNDRSGGIPYPGKRSRGELVTRACGADSAARAAEELEECDPEDYGAFHLLVADTDALFWIRRSEDRMVATEVAPGLHVLGNLSLDAPDDPVVEFVHQAVSPHLADSEADLNLALLSALATNGDGRPCVHRGEYGTKSSALLHWRGANSNLLVCGGPPCEGEFEDHSPMLRKFISGT
jgi:uncharacterized protein with NRDE domain